MVPPPFRDKVRVLPSAESSHFSTAGCHLAMPQKSPIFAHKASAESFEEALALDSSAWAVSPDSSSAAPAATAVLIPIVKSPCSCVSVRSAVGYPCRMTRKTSSRMRTVSQSACVRVALSLSEPLPGVSFRGAAAKRRRVRNPYPLTCGYGFRALGLAAEPRNDEP